MKLLTRLCSVLILPVLLGFAAAADAQMSCNECDPYYSSCDVQCWWCNGIEHQDGYCNWGDVAYSTCGEYMGACLRYGCTPDFRATSRTTVGTYGATIYGWQCTWGNGCSPVFACEHHRVDRVTETDINQCNTNSAYWTRQRCDDYVDATKPFKSYPPPDCCDPFICMPYPDPRCYYDDTYTCNDWHSCW